MAESISSKSFVESPWRLPIDSNFQRRNFRHTAINGVLGDDPINLCKLPVAMAASVDLVSLDCGPSQIMIDLERGTLFPPLLASPSCSEIPSTTLKRMTVASPR